MPQFFCPQKGDIIWLTLDPRVGHEQGGHRPVIVLSPACYNRPTGMALCCPITSQIKGFPFEVLIPEGLKISGAILADQARNLDWKARKAAFYCKAPADVLREVVEKIHALLEG